MTPSRKRKRLAEQERRHQEANTTTHEQANETHVAEFFDRQLDLIRAAIALWAGSIGTFGIIAIDHGALTAGVIMILLGIGSGIFDLWLTWKWRVRRSEESLRAPLTLFVQTNAVVPVVACGAAYPLVFPSTWRIVDSSSMTMRYTARPDQLSTFNFFHFVAPQRNGLPPLYDVYPLHFIVQIELANLLPEPRSLTGYSLETEIFPWEWRRMCLIDLSKGQLMFSAKNAAHGFLLKLASLDSKLGKIIPAKGTVTGWSAWQCPDTDCSNSNKRLVLREASGRQEIVPLHLISQRPDRFMANGEIGLLGKGDFSDHQWVIENGNLCFGEALP
jgi:hypothetical protein